jgi:bis(5'-nucleosyl)-tetraphosphatase (symmetrical)
MTARSTAKRKRRIFVGDIQGCSFELRRLLERVRFDPGSDRLHPVGDFVNRGPDSLGVLRLMREVDAGGVLGNHDRRLLRIAAGKATQKRGDTIDDVLAAPDREELVDWLAKRPFVRGWPDILLVHAGLHPQWLRPERVLRGLDPLARDPAADFATRVRYATRSGRLPKRDELDPGGPFKPWYAFYPPKGAKPRIVVFGHWSMRGLVKTPLLRGLDTGCVWGGRLTAWIAEEDRLVHVPAARSYARP